MLLFICNIVIKMYKKSSTTHKILSVCLWLTASVFILAGILFILEKKGVINIYTKQTPNTNNQAAEDTKTTGTVESSKPVNTVDYNSLKSPDNLSIPGKSPTTPTSQTSQQPIDFAVTRVTKNSTMDTLLIKIAVSGLESGTCAVTMTSGNTIVESRGTISLLGAQYGCTGQDIALQKLSSSPTWTMRIVVSDDKGSQKEATQEVSL